VSSSNEEEPHSDRQLRDREQQAKRPRKTHRVSLEPPRSESLPNPVAAKIAASTRRATSTEASNTELPPKRQQTNKRLSEHSLQDALAP
jgi:hypothetical protein